MIDDLERGLKGQLKYADRIKAGYVVIIGDDELEKGKATLRNMNKSEQTEVPFEELFDALQK